MDSSCYPDFQNSTHTNPNIGASNIYLFFQLNLVIKKYVFKRTEEQTIK